MATRLRPLFSTSLRAQRTFASSSRVGLDFTLPRRASNPTTTTTVDLPPHLRAPAQPTSSGQPPRGGPSVVPNFTKPASQRVGLNNPPNAESTPLIQSVAPPSINVDGMRYKPIDPTAETEHNVMAVTHTFNVKSTRNNVHLTFADAMGPLWKTITAGSDKIFKKSQRSTYEAAHQAALKMFEKVLTYARENRVQLRISFNGLDGTGRDAVSSAITGPEGVEFRRLIVSIEDRTPLRIGGTRPKKRRSV